MREWSVVRGMRGAPKKAAQSVSPEAIALEIERIAGLSSEGANSAEPAISTALISLR